MKAVRQFLRRPWIGVIVDFLVVVYVAITLTVALSDLDGTSALEYVPRTPPITKEAGPQ